MNRTIPISDYSIDYALPTGELSDVETWSALKDIDYSLSFSEDFAALEICNTALAGATTLFFRIGSSTSG